jgi:hypothetical protein
MCVCVSVCYDGANDCVMETGQVMQTSVKVCGRREKDETKPEEKERIVQIVDEGRTRAPGQRSVAAKVGKLSTK